VVITNLTERPVTSALLGLIPLMVLNLSMNVILVLPEVLPRLQELPLVLSALLDPMKSTD